MRLEVISSFLAISFALDHDLYDAGQKQYQVLVSDSKHPKYGACWSTVLEKLNFGCRQLTEDTQHRLALGFTNCFLEKTGRPTYRNCEDDGEISICVRDMDAPAFGAYTNFFSHAQSLCYFLESVRWQENAELTINRLIDQSRLFEERLQDWNSSVVAFENRTLSLQSQLVEAGLRLSSTLDQSQAAVAVMRQASADQHAIIRDVFRQLTSLQEMVVDEFAGFYAYAYYVASTGLAYVLTSTQRTESARIPMLAVTSATFAVERFMLKQLLHLTVSLFGSESSNEQAVEVSATSLHGAVWWLRRLAVFICLCLLGWSSVRFRDLHAINNSLLEGVAREQRHLRRIYSVIMTRSRSRQRSVSRESRRHAQSNREGYSRKPRDVSQSRIEADDEGDGGRVDDDAVSVVSSVSTISKSRYNLRSSSVASNVTPVASPTLREMTPASTVRSSTSRSRSRSQANSTPTKKRSQRDSKLLNSSVLSDVDELNRSGLLASVEASARRVARSARMGRRAIQQSSD